LFDVLAWEIKNFSVSVVARNKIADLGVRITTIYGSPYEEKKDEFISELHELFLHWKGSAIIGGDFNLVRSQLDKNNGIIDHRWADKFNVWI
jgi:endonuclease/exonuclease/phosphatase (EEP) superfamily protein YafD